MDRLLRFDTGIFDNLYEGVYCVDLENKIYYWNKAAEELTGYSAEEVEGSLFWYDLLKFVTTNEDDYDLENIPNLAHLNSDDFLDNIVLLEHKTGYTIPISIRFQPLTNSSGENSGFIIMFDSMTPYGDVEHKLELLENLAMLDQLTQIPNRRYTKHIIDLRVEEYKRKEVPFGLLFLDIDHFKVINDTYGHKGGDIALELITKEINNHCQDIDFFGRWGGEEFILISSTPDLEKLEVKAEEIRVAIKELVIKYLDDLFSVTISIGGTMIKAGDDSDEIIDRSDKFMYLSKTNGRDKVTVG